ncbi:hypothetical protein BDB00DRAFT_803362 [Zychaea mexicana]|uniref:uncharacterized protein n=1 Tax=Zychaea mexicana TaxID=64656 RepID=UPI0022FE9EBF|nr:uncharacterized protein BDB00DRAFT_803362 [Zychaea mexicana]KAI9497611.1 hypothetical protein BDB00DRAFT_803362 [Zychaea mexicana]
MSTLFVLQSNITNNNSNSSSSRLSAAVTPSSTPITTATTTNKRSTGYMNSERRSSSSAASSSSTTDCSSSDGISGGHCSSSNTSVNNDIGPIPQSSNVHLAVGTRVIVPSLCVIGTLRFLGDTKFKPGVWAGIELDVEGAGKNDGSVQGIRYFKCPEHTGLFVQAFKVTPMPSGMEIFDEEEEEQKHQQQQEKELSVKKSHNHPSADRPVARSCASSGCCSNKMRSSHSSSTTTTTKSAAPPVRRPTVEPSLTKSTRLRNKKTTVPSASKSTVRRASTSSGNSNSNDDAGTKPISSSKSTLRRSSDATPMSSRRSVVPQQTKSRSTVTTIKSTASRKSTVPQLSKSRSTTTRSDLQSSVTTTTMAIRRSAVPQTATATIIGKRPTNVPQQTKSRSTVTARDLRKTTTPRRPTATRRSSDISAITTRSIASNNNTAALSSSIVSSPAPRTTSRSTTTRRTKHSIHNHSSTNKRASSNDNEHERLRQLLEESRKEHEKLTQELTGKEAAWERVLSSKESYALQVKEGQQEIRRLKDTISTLELERETWLSSRTGSVDDQQRIEQQQQRIVRLDKLVQQLQQQQMETQAKHDEQMRHHAAEMAQLRRALAERDSVTATLEKECASLRKAGMDAIQMYESSTDALKQQHQQTIDSKLAQIVQLSEALDQQQKKQQSMLLLSPSQLDNEAQHIAIATDQRRRLEEQLQIATFELERERSEKKQKTLKVDQLTEEIVRLHRAASSSDKQFDTLQQELGWEIKDKRRIMEEANVLQQKYLKLQDKLEEITLANNKLEHELAESKRKVVALDQKSTAAERSCQNMQKSYMDQQQGVDDHNTHWLILDRFQKQCQQLEAEKQQLQCRVKELESSSSPTHINNRRISSGPVSPLSPVSMASFSSLIGRLQHDDEDQTYCEICEVYGHDVMSCTAYLTTTPANTSEKDKVDHHRESEIYCLDCDVFGTHQTEDCPNSDEMF